MKVKSLHEMVYGRKADQDPRVDQLVHAVHALTTAMGSQATEIAELKRKAEAGESASKILAALVESLRQDVSGESVPFVRGKVDGVTLAVSDLVSRVEKIETSESGVPQEVLARLQGVESGLDAAWEGIRQSGDSAKVIVAATARRVEKIESLLTGFAVAISNNRKVGGIEAVLDAWND